MKISIPANCNCGNITEPLPSLHAGTCAVWPLHHNLDANLKPVTVLVAAEGIIHVGLVTPIRDLDSKATRARITKGARQWAVANGFTDQVTRVSDGWTLGKDEAETRLTFSLMGR